MNASAFVLGAYYFGMWSPAAYNPPDLVFSDARFYVNQGQDHWLGVRTIHDALDLQSINQSDPNWQQHHDVYEQWLLQTPELKRKPAIGYYDTAQVDTLYRHIEQATTYGLKYFNFYYYWQAYTKSEEMVDGLHSFLVANNTNKMDFMISICADGWYHSIVRSQIPYIANLLATKYFNRSNYLRVNGSPLIGICNAVGIMEDSQLPTPPSKLDWSTNGPINTFINAIRLAAYDVTGHWPTIVGRFDSSTSDYVEGLNNLVEGGTCILSWAPGNGDYNWQASHTAQNLDGIRTSKPFMPCVAHTIDERPRMGVIKNGDADAFFWFPNYSLDGFITALTGAKQWMEDQTDPLSRYLTVYAWNEWHEGGIIEPSERDGPLNLQAINGVFKLV